MRLWYKGHGQKLYTFGVLRWWFRPGYSYYELTNWNGKALLFFFIMNDGSTVLEVSRKIIDLDFPKGKNL